MTPPDSADRWTQYLGSARKAVADSQALESRGTLTRLAGLVLEASGIRAPVGSQCVVTMKNHVGNLVQDWNGLIASNY